MVCLFFPHLHVFMNTFESNTVLPKMLQNLFLNFNLLLFVSSLNFFNLVLHYRLVLFLLL